MAGVGRDDLEVGHVSSSHCLGAAKPFSRSPTTSRVGTAFSSMRERDEVFEPWRNIRAMPAGSWRAASS